MPLSPHITLYSCESNEKNQASSRQLPRHDVMFPRHSAAALASTIAKNATEFLLQFTPNLCLELDQSNLLTRVTNMDCSFHSYSCVLYVIHKSVW